MMKMFCSFPPALGKAAFKQRSHWNRAYDAETEDNKTARETDRAQAGKGISFSKKEQKVTALHNHTDGYQHLYYCITYLLSRRNVKVFQ